MILGTKPEEFPPLNTSNCTTVMLDPSAIRESGCILRLMRMVHKGYTYGVNANDIEFGSAFHAYRKRYVEVQYDKALNISDPDMLHAIALKSGMHYWDNVSMFVKNKKEYLNKTYLEKTCYNYTQHYKRNGDEYGIATIAGKPLIELRLALPYYKTPEGDIEIILCGTIDKIVKHLSLGFYAICDYKTTAVWDRRKYFEFYRMSTQMMTYKFVLKKYAQLFPNTELSEMLKFNIPAIIDGVFHKPSADAQFERSEPLWYSEKQMEEYEFGLNKLITRIVSAIRNPKELFREGMLNGSCEKIYGACNYFDSCAAPTEEEANHILNSRFIIRPYNPMMHGELQAA